MQIRGNFSDYFFETALPANNAVIWQAYKQKPMLYKSLFQVETSNRSIEQHSQVSGVGLFSEIPEGGEVRTDQPIQGFDKTFRHRRYGLAVEMSRDLVEDDNFGLVKRQNIELGLSCNETIEIDAATTFNYAFTTTGPDGVTNSSAGPDGKALCATDHPLWKAGGTQSNLGTAADLDVDALDLALVAWETMKRANGHLVGLPTPRLLVAPANRLNAHEILKGMDRSDTANRTINAFKYGENGPVDDILVWARLTDSDAWFLVAEPSQTGLIWYWRVKPYTKGFFDDRTERGGTAMRYKKSHGFTDYLGVYGNAGV
jgi:phage major head subunit gpT-like protein